MLKKLAKFKDNIRFFDLVCGMELSFPEVKYINRYEGGKYYFCSKSCQKHFASRPGMYVYS